MKMVAASRLRRAQEQAEAARPYAQRMERMLASLAARSARAWPNAPPLLAGTGRDQAHLLVVATSDRGLAGGFNATILREARRMIRELDGAGKTVKILTIGRKGRDALRRDHARLIVDSLTDIGRPRLTLRRGARHRRARRWRCFAAGEFDACTIVYNRFHSAMTQIVTRAAADPVRAARGAPTRRRREGGRSTSSSRTRRRFSPSCCRAISRCRSTPRCSRTPRASRARA